MAESTKELTEEGARVTTTAEGSSATAAPPTEPKKLLVALTTGPATDPSKCALAFLVAIHEVLSVFTFNSPFGGELWSIRSDYASGDLGWDPLGLKPTNPAELKDMQTKEINNGRLAMIGIVGMLGQELAHGEKLFA